MQPNFSLTDPSNAAVPKYEMPPEMYGQLTDSVLAWKKAQKLGRFDPDAPAAEAGRVAAMWNVVEEKGIVVGVRCRVGNGDGDGEDGDGDGGRRGLVRFVGEIDELPGVKGGAWVGVELDEPVGRNDGFVGGGQGKRMVFECGRKRGVFVRGEKVVVGDFPVLEIGLNEDMEEI